MGVDPDEPKPEPAYEPEPPPDGGASHAEEQPAPAESSTSIVVVVLTTAKQQGDAKPWVVPVLTLVFSAAVAVGSLLSALGSNRSANAARVSADVVQASVRESHLAQMPLLVSSCEPRQRRKGPLPSTVLLLENTTTSSVPTSDVPTYSVKGVKLVRPRFYVACMLSNFGKLPALNVRYTVGFRSGLQSSARKEGRVALDVIPAGESAKFAIVNMGDPPLYLDYPEDATLTDPSIPERHTTIITNAHELNDLPVRFMPGSARWIRSHVPRTAPATALPTTR